MKQELLSEVDRVIQILANSQRVCIYDLRNLLVGYSNAVAGQIIWKARERLRLETGVDFGPVRNLPGYIQRREPKQIAAYAQRQRSKGTRAHVRALGRMRLAASKSTDTKEKERLERMAEREEERQNFKKRRI